MRSHCSFSGAVTAALPSSKANRKARMDVVGLPGHAMELQVGALSATLNRVAAFT